MLPLWGNHPEKSYCIFVINVIIAIEYCHYYIHRIREQEGYLKTKNRNLCQGIYRYNCCFSSTPQQVSTSRIKWVEAGHARIPALPRFVFMLCMGCLYRQAEICLGLWLKNRSERLFCPSWLLRWLHQPFHILKETRLTPLCQVQWAIETSDRQILKVSELILDKPSNILVCINH